MNTKYSRIIKRYRKFVEKHPDMWISYCQNQPDLATAIYQASISRNKEGKKHPHQYRIPNSILFNFADILIRNQEYILDATSFDKLYKTIRRYKIFGIGDVTLYDITHRIGAYMGLEPDMIYLHAGTKTGANKLLGGIIRAKSLRKDILPEPFRSSELTPSELEDILCIYKDEF